MKNLLSTERVIFLDISNLERIADHTNFAQACWRV